MKGDLISRIALIEKIDSTDWYHISEIGTLEDGANSKLHTPLFKADDIFSAVENAPAVDVDSEYKHSFEMIAAKYAKIQDKMLKGELVEIVRCKNCRFYHDFETHFDCSHPFGLDDVQPTDFCIYGKRREDKE